MNADKVVVDDSLSVHFEEPIMIKSEPLEFEPIDSLTIISKKKKEQLYGEINSQKMEILRLKEKLKKSELKRCEQFLKIRILTELRSHFNVSIESTKMETDESTQTARNEMTSRQTQTSMLELKQLQTEPKVLIVYHSAHFWYRKGKIVKQKLDRNRELVHGVKSRNVSKSTLKLKKIVDEVISDLVKFSTKLADQNPSLLYKTPISKQKDKILCDMLAFQDILELSKSKIDHDQRSTPHANLGLNDWKQQRERIQLKNLADKIIA